MGDKRQLEVGCKSGGTGDSNKTSQARELQSADVACMVPGKRFPDETVPSGSNDQCTQLRTTEIGGGSDEEYGGLVDDNYSPTSSDDGNCIGVCWPEPCDDESSLGGQASHYATVRIASSISTGDHVGPPELSWLAFRDARLHRRVLDIKFDRYGADYQPRDEFKPSPLGKGTPPQQHGRHPYRYTFTRKCQGPDNEQDAAV